MPRLVLWTTLTLAGIWSAMVLDRKMSSSDNQSIVIDEVVGLGITAWTAGSNAVSLICAFFLFRAFDIIKPFPVRQLDRWSKKMASTRQGSSYFWGGLGVMADDIVAGFQGLAVMLVLQHFGWI